MAVSAALPEALGSVGEALRPSMAPDRLSSDDPYPCAFMSRMFDTHDSAVTATLAQQRTQ